MAYYDLSVYGYKEDKGLIHEPLANLPFSKWVRVFFEILPIRLNSSSGSEVTPTRTHLQAV